MWGSLLVLGISAAVFGLGRNRNKNMVRPIQNLKNNFRMEKGSQKLNLTGLTEFAKELIPDKNQFTKNSLYILKCPRLWEFKIYHI